MDRPSLRFQGVELYFDDLEGAKSFYQGILGLELGDEEADRYARFDADSAFICLERKGTESSRQRTPFSTAVPSPARACVTSIHGYPTAAERLLHPSRAELRRSPIALRLSRLMRADDSDVDPPPVDRGAARDSMHSSSPPTARRAPMVTTARRSHGGQVALDPWRLRR
jgi:hypothetical protein